MNSITWMESCSLIEWINRNNFLLPQLMKKLIILPTMILLFSLLVAPVLATTDTSVSDLVGSTTETTTTPPVATQANNALLLDIPTQTDNPSTIITFTNPSKNNTVVQLEIDSKGFVDITSPYTFPALSIGKHTLEFKYQDENASTQLYDTSIIIIPRAPILGTPVISAEKVTISGTGLANSEIILLLSSGSTVLTENTIIDGDGRWSIDFTKTELGKDIFSLNAYTRRYGYASDLSETTKFTLDSQSSISAVTNVAFDIRNITLVDIKNWIIINQNYLIIAASSLLLGIMLGILSVSKRKQKAERKIEKKVAEKFTKTDIKDSGITLREKLMGTVKTEEPKVEEKEKKEEEKIVNKIDFLKDFKNFDPDNSKGEEKQPAVDISLTSKK